MATAAQFLSIVPVAALAFVAMSDVASRQVPNWACGLIAASGLLQRVVSGDWALSLLAAAVVFAALFVCFVRGWLGGGDVKLLAACVLLVPAHAVPTLMAAVPIAGGILGLAYLVGRIPRLHAAASSTVPASFIRRVCRVEAWRIRRHLSLPYACAIAAGSVFTLVIG